MGLRVTDRLGVGVLLMLEFSLLKLCSKSLWTPHPVATQSI
jgi:hypothetical protein